MSEIMTDEQLAELERLRGESPTGAWKAMSPTWNRNRRNCKTAIASAHGTVCNTVTPKVPREGTFGSRQPEACSIAKYIAALHNAFPALLHRLREAEREREEAEQEVEELQTNADEYEKDCTKALFAIANECEYEWDGDGATADDLREYISTTLEECKNNEQPLLEKIRVIERERAYLAGEVVRLRCENARQRKIGAAAWLRENNERLDNMNRADVEQEIERLEKEAGDV